jgi:hypothetical protein
MCDLPVPFGAKLDQVVVSLAKRDQADQLGQLAALAEHLRIKADALHQQVDPLVGGELLAGLNVAVEIEMGQLNRLESGQDPRAGAFVFGKLIFQISNAPHSADQQVGVFFHRSGINKNLFDTQVGELRLIDILLVVQIDTDLVDDLVAPLFLDVRAD